VHSLVRRFIKTAVAFLVLGLAIGTWTLVRREVFLRPPNPYEVSAHTHAILVGFVMTIGTAARIASELARTGSTAVWLRSIVVAGGLAQLAGIVLFFFTMWPRIRAAGSHIREAKGERF